MLEDTTSPGPKRQSDGVRGEGCAPARVLGGKLRGLPFRGCKHSCDIGLDSVVVFCFRFISARTKSNDWRQKTEIAAGRETKPETEMRPLLMTTALMTVMATVAVVMMATLMMKMGNRLPRRKKNELKSYLCCSSCFYLIDPQLCGVSCSHPGFYESISVGA